MYPLLSVLVVAKVVVLASTVSSTSVNNNSTLNCYQCKKTSFTECPSTDLQPCSPDQNICVTIISKSVADGFYIKRECGKSPCRFEDEDVNVNLGLERCDLKKKEYFCFFCCKENGCNKNNDGRIIRPVEMLYLIVLYVPFSMFVNKLCR
ncbi:unnamed protein product [Acanthoscelides obtectus]|uniref:UPAR/Ly6 domain-containing protein n=1 Tax=Acanthoscelides obtectus TaxID=200917 RepID=A0A9P0L6N0_ACAOB|nr:unnamed protein product [Acanthoscelides obtectus]CAK1670694.1 hypothetical protein AOBTE_LOCUS27769 [Acanthoscelides obtectus]